MNQTVQNLIKALEHAQRRLNEIPHNYDETDFKLIRETLAEAKKEKAKHWFEIGVDNGDEGTMSLASTDTLDEAKKEAKSLRAGGEDRPMFIDRWSDAKGGEPDETFTAIHIDQKGKEIK